MTPASRYARAMAYDAARSSVVIFGGYSDNARVAETWPGTPTATVPAGVSGGTRTDGTVSTGVDYHYRVRAVKAAGPSPWSEVAVGTPAVAPALGVFDEAPRFTFGQPGSSVLVASGQPAPTWEIVSGVLPTGLTLVNAANGTATIQGTPAAGQVGAHPVMARATNLAGTVVRPAGSLPPIRGTIPSASRRPRPSGRTRPSPRA